MRDERVYEGSDMVRGFVYLARQRDGWITDEQFASASEIIEFHDQITSDPLYLAAKLKAKETLEAARNSYDPELWDAWATASVASQRAYYELGTQILHERKAARGR